MNSLQPKPNVSDSRMAFGTVWVVNWLPLTVRLKFPKLPVMLLALRFAVAAFSFFDGNSTEMILLPDTIAAILLVVLN